MRDAITARVIGAAMEVHSALGPGLLESAYEKCLSLELTARGLAHRRQVELPIHYKGVQVDGAYRLDLVVEDHVIVEIKATAHIAPIHRTQLLSYLKLSGMRVGLLLNFHAAHLRDGMLRLINTPRL